MRIYLTLLTLIGAVCSSHAIAELTPLADAELTDMYGQTGITVSARAELGEGTRISYQNSDAEYEFEGDYWLILDDITGSIEFKNLQVDLVSDAGVTGQKSALRVTLPEEVKIKNLKVGGVYLGVGREKTNDHQFLLAPEINGTLKMPSQTKATLFALD